MMKIEVAIILSQAYYQEVYEEWLRFRSKGKRWQVQVGLVLFGVAFLLAMLCGPRLHALWFIPFCFVLAGIYEIGSFFYTRRQWLQNRNDSRLVNQLVTVTFEPQAITHTGPFAQGQLLWTGIREVKETARGVFLIPESGNSIYLPKTAFPSPDQFQLLLEYAKEGHHML
ncbi:hypothetical protein PK28_01525 [Hymenobacter sp. DG25B]|uniref:YcxB family protein n=1 Tax=Hymenobacter sp. DG25B TaxID=1385664 RepID=UPI000540D87E|nr:YcxB family protein [Hymenobacter sp. DG25B]AIZ62686.1 hypothetical protein PK28_01525 [Hymenobacter sp. DG25B]